MYCFLAWLMCMCCICVYVLSLMVLVKQKEDLGNLHLQKRRHMGLRGQGKEKKPGLGG